MRVVFTLIAFFVFGLFEITGQEWYPSSPIYYGRDVNSIHIFNRSSVLLAGGENHYYRTLLNSDNYGASWNIAYDVYSPWLESVAFGNALNGIAVGEDSIFLKTTNGGANWSSISAPITANFNKIVYADVQTIFVVGGNDSTQVILKSTDSGNNWNVILNQPGNLLKSVYFTNTQNGIAVGDSGTILKTINGGTSWTSVAPPAQRDFNGITFINSSTGFIVGGKETNGALRTILKTTDGGTNWSIIKDEAGAWLTDISFVDQNTGYAVGDLGSLFKTENGGQTWNQQTVNGSNGTEYFNTINFYDPNFGVIGAKAGKAFIYTDAIQPEVDSVWGSYQDSSRYLVQSKINAYGTPTTCSVEFSTDSSFIPTYYSYNQYVNADTFSNVNIYLTGLFSNTRYYYRFVVKTILSTEYIDTLNFFTYTPRYTIETDSADNISLNSAQLKGSVDKIFFNGHPYFQYGLLPSLIQGQTINAIPATITDTLPHTVSVNISQLLPDTTYYYTLIMQTPYGFVTGDTFSFHTESPGYAFHTQNASDITNTSATLNGTIFRLPEAANIYFEYGTTTDFGNTIAANPILVNDTLYHAVTGQLTSLLSNTYYYFRLRGNGSNGNYIGSVYSFFTGNNQNNIITLPATGIFATSALLNGTAQVFSLPANVYFELCLNPTFDQNSVTTPQIINDTLPHTISGIIYPEANTLYYFRLKAQTSLGDYNGNTLSFYSVNPYSVFETNSATAVTGNTAQLNGSLAGLTNSTNLSFQYGSTPSLGSEIEAVPAVLNDIQPHSVSAVIGDLLPNTVYYYRLKGTAAGYNDFFGNIRQIYTGASEIPNWDFQFWQVDTFILPNYWKSLTKNIERVQGHSGNYAAKISHSSAILLGNFVDADTQYPGFYGGQLMQARPDSIQAYINYNIAEGDTGSIYIHMYSGTNSISETLYPITGNSSGIFEKVSFPILYNSPLTPDSVAILILSSNLLGGGNSDYHNNYITIDDISFTPSTPLIMNGDFENWFPFIINHPLSWGSTILYYTLPSATPFDPFVTQTIFEAPDDFAAELKNVIVDGFLTSGDLMTNENPLIDRKPTFSVEAKHQYLNGYYQFYPVGGDTMRIGVTMYYQGQEIGWGELTETDTVNYFKPFNIPIHYMDSLTTPDSADIQIAARSIKTFGTSRLVIDKLSFDGFTSIDENNRESSITESGLLIYPNPAKDRVIVEIENKVNVGDYIQLFSINGQLMKELLLSPNQNRIELNLTEFESGFYLINVIVGNRTSNGKIVVVK